MLSIGVILIGLLQALAILALAPLFSGFSRVLRAKMHNRRGPSVFQNYRDLAKLMKRQEVASSQAGWVFRMTPSITMASMLLVAMIVPVFAVQPLSGWFGDLILVAYLFALSRFCFVLSGFDTGSPLGGLGAKRELVISALIEPVLLLVLFVMALLAGSTNLGVISTKIASGQIFFYTSVWLGMLAFAFATYVEMGKLPFDMAEAEQELQEGPLAEFSGPALALMKWGIYVKQIVLVSLFIAVFLPFGNAIVTSPELPSLQMILLGVVLFILKVGFFYFVMALLENAMARVRFSKASVAIWAAWGAAILSFVFYLANV